MSHLINDMGEPQKLQQRFLSVSSFWCKRTVTKPPTAKQALICWHCSQFFSHCKFIAYIWLASHIEFCGQGGGDFLLTEILKA